MTEKKLPEYSGILKWVLLGVVLLFFGWLVLTINLSTAKNESLTQDKHELTYFQAFSLQRFDGSGTFTQDDLKETKLTLINGWAPWCNPCTSEMPGLQALSEEYADQGVQIVGVVADYYETTENNYDESIQNILNNTGVTYPVLVSDEAFYENAVPLMNYSFPGTWVVDSEGNMLDFVTGSREEADWQDLIERWLAGETWIGDNI